jgi:hypothetical protein
VSTIVAIHQPNFFPWLGYFDKIRQADVFVFLDDVSYPRSGSGGMGSWCNRVKIAINGEARWATCPLRRMALGSPIRLAEIDDSQSWRIKLVRTLEVNYRRAPAYQMAVELLGPLIMGSSQSLAEFNITAIKVIAAQLRIDAHFVRQSELVAEGQSTELLVSIVKAVGGNAYLAGGGASGYQDDALFATNEITLVPQSFVPSIYGNPAAFIPGLSVIDYLMNDGRPLDKGG